MSRRLIPARASTWRVAGIGAVSMITGSTPPSAKAWKRARGRRPRASAFRFSITSTALAPSVIWLELPAVMTPSGLNAGLRDASFSRLVSGRTPSSVAIASRDPSSRRTSTGTSSLANQPLLAALPAFW